MAAPKGNKFALGCLNNGAPSKYSSEFIPIVKLFSKAGLSQAQMAELLKISVDTLWRWMKDNQVFSEAVKGGKGVSDDVVERSLYERALGYSHPDVHITNYQGDITETEIIKHYPPDPTSAIFWLKNRRPEQWRERQELEITGKLDALAKVIGELLLSYVPEDKRRECADRLAGVLNG